MPTLPGHTDPGNVDDGDTLDPTWGDNVRASINNNAGYLAKDYVLDVDTTLVTVENTTTETTLWSYTLPANTLGASGNIVTARLKGHIENNEGNSRVSTFKFYYGSTSVLAACNISSGADEVFLIEGTLIGTGATNTQWISIGGSVYGMSWYGSEDASVAEDSTTDLVVKITLTHSLAHASIIGYGRHTVCKLSQS